MLGREPWTGLMGFHPTARRETMCKGCKTRTSARVPDARIMRLYGPMPSTGTWMRTGESSSRTNELLSVVLRRTVGLPQPTLQEFRPATLGESKTGMNLNQKNFHKSFATFSLGFALLGFSVLPCFAAKGSGTASGAPSGASRGGAGKREAASTQFAKAEDMRSTLNGRSAERKTLTEYMRVTTAYRMVYVITPHAVQVPTRCWRWVKFTRRWATGL